MCRLLCVVFVFIFYLLIYNYYSPIPRTGKPNSRKREVSGANRHLDLLCILFTSMQSLVAAIECKVYRPMNFSLYSAKCKLTDVRMLYREVGLRTLKSRGDFS